MEKSYVRFDHVSFRYQENEDLVLNHVSFDIKENEWIAIIGHNGSGKSTIAKLMNGLLFPEEGTVKVDQELVNEQTMWNVRSKVGMVFQNPDNQFVGTTVQDDVAFGLENHSVPREDMLVRLEDSLHAVGMLEYKNHEPHRLSGGQKQRVAIASVLAVAPEVLILDEATAMLDPKGRREIMKTVQAVRETRDVAVVTITHDLNEVTLADRVIVMNKGEVWFEGTPREVFAKKDELKKIGLDTPFATKLAQALREVNLDVRQEPLNHKELMDELWRLHLKK